MYLDFVGPDGGDASDSENDDMSLTKLSTAKPCNVAARKVTQGTSVGDAGVMQDENSLEHDESDVCRTFERAEYSGDTPTVVEARAKFFVVPPPPSRLAHDSSGIISSAEQSCSQPTSCCASTSVEADASQGSHDAILLKECSHRFSEPDNDWGFRELMGTTRAKRYLDDEGSLTIRAQVLVYWEAYTRVKDKIMVACSSCMFNWLEIIPLVQEYGDMAANVPTRVGLEYHNDRASLFHAACKIGSKDYAALLIARGATTATEDDSGRTPLFYAAHHGHLEVVRWLIDEQGIPVNARDSGNRSAIFYASEEGRIDVVEELILKGADVNSADFEGETPARLAESNGHYNIATLLHSLRP